MTRRLALPALLALAACGPKKVPPPAPDVQATAATTELATQLVSGSAEYLSMVAVTRTPAFTASETAPASVVADQYTARFQMTLPLQPGQNVFSFTATDANGSSPATTVTITRNAAAPAGLTLLPLNPIVTDGNLIVRATITNPEPIPLAGFEIDFSATPGAAGGDAGAAGTVTASAQTDGSGVAQVTLSGLAVAGPWTITAKSKDDPQAEDSAQVLVNGGFGSAQLDLVLTGQDATGKAVTSQAGALTVAAGTSVTAQIAPAGKDLGPYLSIPFTLTTNAPHGGIYGNVIAGLDAAAATPYQVAATVPPSAATGEQLVVLSAALTVSAAAPDHFKITVAPQAVAGTATPVGVEVQDAYGNDETLTTAPQLATTDTKAHLTQGTLSGGALVGAQVTFATAGVQTVTASSPQFATLTAGDKSSVSVVPGAPTALDLTLTANGSTVTPSSQLLPNTPITIQTAVLDASGNPIPGAAVSVQTDAPGILALPSLTGVTKAGSYHVVAAVVGAAISQVAPFTVIAGPATQIALTLSQAQATADQPVSYTAVPEDAYGNPTGDSLSASIADAAGNVVYPGVTPPLAQVTGNATNEAGTVQIYVANSASGTSVTLGGSTVTVGAGAAWTVKFADATAKTVSASASLAIAPGAAASISVTLGAGQPNASATIAAGSTLAFSTTVQDDHGNTLPGLPVELSTSAPGAVVTTTTPGQGQIQNLTVANTPTTPYYVWATVPASGLTSPPVQLFVTPGPASTLHFSVAALDLIAGNAVPYSWTISDASGNLLDLTSNGQAILPSLTISAGPPSGALESPPPQAPSFNAATDLGTGELAFTTTSPAGIYTLEVSVPASFNVLPAFQTVLLSQPQDVVPPTVTVTAQDPAGNNLAGGSVNSGQTITVTVTACDDTDLTSLYAQLSGAFNRTRGPVVPTNNTPGTGSCAGGVQASQSWSVTVPGGSNGTEQLVATATDTGNNTGVSPVVTFRVNPLQVDPTWIGATGVLQLGLTSLPLNGPVGLTVDSSTPGNPQLYLTQNGDWQVLRYDTASDSYGVFASVAATGHGAPNFDIAMAGQVLYVSQNNVNFNGGGGQPAIVQIPVAAPSTASILSDDLHLTGLMPEGLANCPLASGTSTTLALLALDDQTGPGGSGNEQADFLSFTTGNAVAGSPVPLTAGGFLGNPFAGVTGTNLDGSCSTVGSTTDAVFAADDNVDVIRWFKLAPVYSSATVATRGQTCTLNGAGGSRCVNAAIGVRLSTNHHLVWANSGNGTVAYATVDPTSGAVTGSPAILIGGLNTPTGLAFDSSNRLYVADNGVTAPNGGTGAVYRITLNAGF